MLKIFSGLTLVVALVAVFFGLQSKDLVGKLQVAAERDHTDLLATREKLKKTEKDLAETKAELAAIKEELAKTKDTLVKTEADLAKAKGELTAATEAKAAAEAQYADVKKKFDDLSAKFQGKNPEEILKAIADMETANKDLTAKVAEAEVAVTTLKADKEDLLRQKKVFDEQFATQKKIVDRYQKNIMIKGTRGHVLAVNAGWGFCVLSIGDRQGAAANKIMIVARGGQAIGKVRIINVESSQSVADIIPSSFTRGMYVEPGDDVIFTGEDKVPEAPADAAGKTPATTGAPGVPALPQP